MEKTESRLRETINGILFYAYWFAVKRSKTRVGAQHGAFAYGLIIIIFYSTAISFFPDIAIRNFPKSVSFMIMPFSVIICSVWFVINFFWKNKYRDIVYNIKKYRTRKNLRNYYLFGLSGYVLFCVSMAAGCCDNQRKYGKHEENHSVHIDTQETAIQQRK